MEWHKTGNKIEKEFTFENFVKAVEFVNRIVPIAEEADHHPDILIHSYKKVKISLTTHEEGKVTQKDWDLAKKIDQIVLG